MGEGPALIIIHGLYGASDNWVTTAKALSSHFEVFILDQRNHGRSPHSDKHNYDVMKEDLREFMDDHNIETAVLLGHSMGGKTVMFFAAEYPERVNGLIVVDIAPRSYYGRTDYAPRTIDHQSILSSLKEIDLGRFQTRSEIDHELSLSITSDKVRQFLLKNLKHGKDKRFVWKLNITALEQNLRHILEGIDESQFEKGRSITGFPVLFIRGGRSNYITDDDVGLIRKIFSLAEIRTIENTGHWVHAEAGDQLVKCITEFMLGDN